MRLLCGAVLLLAMLALPSAAGAEPMTRLYEGSFGAFQKPQSIAVDQSNGDVYVLDVGARSVSRFDSTLKAKNFSRLNSNVIDGASLVGVVCGANPSPNCDQTPANGFSFDTPTAAQVAIDNSGSPLTNGNIYVTDSLGRFVDVFASTGAYIGQLSRSGAAGPTFGVPCGVTVDPAGALYVGDRQQASVHKFVPSANPPGNADFVGDFSAPQACVLAAGAGPTAGSLFVNRKNGVASKLDSAGTLQYQLGTGIARGVAMDPATGRVLVARESEVAEYDASSAISASLIGSFGSLDLNTVGGVAADGARGKAYVSDTATGKVIVFGPLAPVAAPLVSLGPVTPLSGGREEVSGYVDPRGVPATYHFEYGEADCASNPCTSVPAGEDAAVGKGFGMMRFSRLLTGLRPGTTYHYRLVAGNEGGTTSSADRTFTTLSAPPLSGPCGNHSLRAAQALPPRFPDCRAYEWVSAFPAAERNNASVLISAERPGAAVSGSAFSFLSLSAAGDAQSLPFTTSYLGVRDPAAGWSVHAAMPPQPAVSVADLLDDREPGYVGEFTPDLSRGVILSAGPLNAEGPNVQETWNLYRREDLLAPGRGDYRLLTDAATPQDPHPPGQTSGEDTRIPRLVGASTDLSHVLFESPRDLTADAAGLAPGPRLYMSVDGAVRLVGVLPLSEGGGPSVAQAGQGFHELETQPPLSANGSRVVFTTPPFSGFETIAGVLHSGNGGRLYLRDDRETADTADDTTVKISASEKTNGAGPGGTDPGGEQPASFWAASADFSRIFFTTTEALTNDAPAAEPSVKKLYRYDLDEPGGQRLTLVSVDHNPDDGIKNEAEAVIGASEDGSRVFFIGPNQLVADRPVVSAPRIFAWHEGEIRQVAAVNAGAESANLISRRGGGWTRVSPDGERLIFLTEGTSDLAGYDHGSSCPSGASSRCTEVYMYSTGAEERLQCLSCPDSRASTGDSSLGPERSSAIANTLMRTGSYRNRVLSADGRFVFFTSSERLSPYDENDDPDVYEFETSTGLVHLLSSGRTNVAAHFLDASADGSDVFFGTGGALLSADGNQRVDVYDARVGGGFEEALQPPVVPCASLDACRPPTSSVPEDRATGEAVAPLPEAKRKARHKKRHKHRGKRRPHRSRGSKHGARGKAGGRARG